MISAAKILAIRVTVLLPFILSLCASQAMASEASTACHQWFNNTHQELSSNVKIEKTANDQLGLENRSEKQVLSVLAGVEQTAHALCDRLVMVPDLKVRVTGKALRQNCALTFSDWENQMDIRFTDSVMEKGLLSQVNSLAAGQETHRREAEMAILLCGHL